MANIGHPPVQDAIQKVKELNSDEEAKYRAFVRERALHDEASLMKDARDEGLTLGTLNVVSLLLKKKFGDLPEWAEARLNEASLQQLQHWAAQILTVESLEEALRLPEH